ncbi:hypothetical protein PENTCL1PPCAC_15973 [Pristionchus entomophagus]|uniref:Nuclear receptor n=1 Tax=Pristionchus entomophagus TaxID=358040 RepID=A0AAV5THX1_9BILA|nr:hypothetical protein PENTCL1PPCAC_15973 [Pristionchus entomophagus]
MLDGTNSSVLSASCAPSNHSPTIHPTRIGLSLRLRIGLSLRENISEFETHCSIVSFKALAKQLSTARLFFKQFNHPETLRGCLRLMENAPEDDVERHCAYTVTGMNTVYGMVETVAWLADAKIISGDSAKLFQWCNYLWLVVLSAGIVRQARVLSRKDDWSLEKVKDDVLLLISLCCDFISGANKLPPGMLWAGKLQARTAARLSLVSSLIGLYRTF